LLEQVVRGVAHDRKQPGTTVTTVKPGKIFESSQVALLDYVLRVTLVLEQKTGVVISGIQVRQDRSLERRKFVLRFQLPSPGKYPLPSTKTGGNDFLFPLRVALWRGNNPPDPQVYTSRLNLDVGGEDMKKISEWFLVPPVNGPAATIMLRVMAGSVFLWEGVMKFVFPNQGVGRFTKLGFPAPHFLATGDAWLEIIGGALLMLGLLTRPVAILFVIEMLVAMLSTKIPLYL